MSLSRRTLIEILGTGIATSTLNATSAFAANDTRKLGLIFPPAGRGVPEEGLSMYGPKIDYLIETLGLETMTPDGYEAVIDRIAPAAEKLVQRGAQAVVLMGTSLSFFKGEEFNQRLTQTLKEASGVPSITMGTAVIEGLKGINSQNVVAATAYNDEVNDRLRSFLTEHGMNVLSIQGLGIEAVGDIFDVTQSQLIDFGVNVVNSVQGADSILVSCGGLITLDILAPLENLSGVPAVSSTPHALFAGAKLLGMDGHISGYGSLLSI